VLALRLLGYEKARNFDASFGAWAQELEAPVER
jgi:3-mercaptopyruvate sulfurtransferase SseA